MLVCVFNMAPVERKDFTIGLIVAGIYEEVWNYRIRRMEVCGKSNNQNSSDEGL